MAPPFSRPHYLVEKDQFSWQCRSGSSYKSAGRGGITNDQIPNDRSRGAADDEKLSPMILTAGDSIVHDEAHCDDIFIEYRIYDMI